MNTFNVEITLLYDRIDDFLFYFQCVVPWICALWTIIFVLNIASYTTHAYLALLCYAIISRLKNNTTHISMFQIRIRKKNIKNITGKNWNEYTYVNLRRYALGHIGSGNRLSPFVCQAIDYACVQLFDIVGLGTQFKKSELKCDNFHTKLHWKSLFFRMATIFSKLQHVHERDFFDTMAWVFAFWMAWWPWSMVMRRRIVMIHWWTDPWQIHSSFVGHGRLFHNNSMNCNSCISIRSSISFFFMSFLFQKAWLKPSFSRNFCSLLAKKATALPRQQIFTQSMQAVLNAPEKANHQTHVWYATASAVLTSNKMSYHDRMGCKFPTFGKHLSLTFGTLWMLTIRRPMFYCNSIRWL